MHRSSGTLTADSCHAVEQSRRGCQALWARRLSAVLAGVAAALLSACAGPALMQSPIDAGIRSEIAAARPAAPASATAPVQVPARISAALAEPAPPAVAAPPEPRLDLLVNNAPAREVFLAIVADTRYSMLMHPDVNGTLSVTLRGVTVPQALEAIRDVYGYDFRIEGRRITVFAPSLQTRIFTVNYPNSQRTGSSELRVSSGAGVTAAQGGAAGVNSAQPLSSAVEVGRGVCGSGFDGD